MQRGAISKYPNFCDGFMSPGNHGDGYFIAPVLGVGKDALKFSHTGSSLLDEINAFDLAEVNSAYIGQVNIINVSSFCGYQGLVWGYDVAKAEEKIETRVKQNYKNIDGRNVTIYSMDNILKAVESLFGTKHKRVYPFLPGSHVPCATKSVTSIEPAQLYAAIGFGIPRRREENAIPIMEDVGHCPGETDDEAIILDNVAASILQIGRNQNIVFEKIFVSVKYISTVANEVSCALTAVPYFAIAKNAIPNDNIEELSGMSISNWEKWMVQK